MDACPKFALGIFRPINELEKHPLNKSYLRGSSNDPTDDSGWFAKVIDSSSAASQGKQQHSTLPRGIKGQGRASRLETHAGLSKVKIFFPYKQKNRSAI